MAATREAEAQEAEEEAERQAGIAQELAREAEEWAQLAVYRYQGNYELAITDYRVCSDSGTNYQDHNSGTVTLSLSKGAMLEEPHPSTHFVSGCYVPKVERTPTILKPLRKIQIINGHIASGAMLTEG